RSEIEVPQHFLDQDRNVAGLTHPGLTLSHGRRQATGSRAEDPLRVLFVFRLVLPRLALPSRRRPQLDARVHADELRVVADASELPQLAREQDPARSVDVELARRAEEPAGERARLLAAERTAPDLGHDGVELLAQEQPDAPVETLRREEDSRLVGAKGVEELAGHVDAPLGVDGVRVRADEHPSIPQRLPSAI